ncbi:hypothetical protein [Roseateles sp.]|uniref:hypothetical protein n=1 Tax=Roseateles sp. TaxID=1971397 RepID=UPI002E191330
MDNLTPDQKEAVVNSVKLGGVWASVGVSSWSDVASMLAAILSFLFILEWCWKKVLRPLLEDRGIVRRKRRRRTDRADREDFGAETAGDTDRVGL